MNVNFNYLSNYALSLFKESILPTLNDRQKKIIAIASIALGCLAAFYILRRCCFRAKIIVPTDDNPPLSPHQQAEREALLDEAATKYQEILAVDATDTTALKGYADILHKQGKIEEAVEKYRKILTLVPNAVKTDARFKSSYLSVLEDYAKMLHKQGKLEKAAATYNEIVGIDSECFATQVNYATLLREMGRLPEAKGKIKHILYERDFHSPHNLTYTDYYKYQADPKLKLATFKEYALILTLLNQLSEAETLYKDALAICPEDVLLLGHYAIVLRLQGKLAESEKRFKQALALAPQDFSILFGYAVNLRLQGKLEEAVKYYQKALAVNPKDAYALIEYAATLRLQGRLAEAEATYQEGVALNPQDASVIKHYAAILHDPKKADRSRF